MRPDESAKDQKPDDMSFDKWLTQQLDAETTAGAESTQPPSSSLERRAEADDGDPSGEVGKDAERFHDDLRSIFAMPLGGDEDGGVDASGTAAELGMTGAYGGALWGADEDVPADPGADLLGVGAMSLVTRGSREGEVVKEVMGLTGTFLEISALCDAHNAREERLDGFLKASLKGLAEGMLVRQVAEPVRAGDRWKMKMIQEEVPELRGDPLQLHGGNAELLGRGQTGLDAAALAAIAAWKPEFAAQYARVNAYLIEGKGAPPDLKTLLAFQRCPALDVLVERLRTDEQLREYLRSVLPALVDFSNAPDGEILDTIGSNNMILVRDPEGRLRLRMVDALHPTADLLVQARRTLGAIAEGKATDSQGVKALVDALNYARTVNFLAEVLGLDGQRFQLLPEQLRSAEIDYDRVLEVIRDETRFG